MPKKKTARTDPSARPPLRWKRDERGVLNAVFEDEPAPRTVDQQLADVWLGASAGVDVEGRRRAIRDAHTAEEHRRQLAARSASAKKGADQSTVVRRDKKLGRLREIAMIKKERPDISNRQACLDWHIKNTPGWAAYSAKDQATMLSSLATWYSKNKPRRKTEPKKP